MSPILLVPSRTLATGVRDLASAMEGAWCRVQGARRKSQAEWRKEDMREVRRRSDGGGTKKERR